MGVVDQLKVIFSKKSSGVDQDLIPVVKQVVSNKKKPYVLGDKAESRLDLSSKKLQSYLRSKAEFYIYKKLSDAIESDKIFASHTIRYLRFEEDLIDKETWESSKESLLAQCELHDIDDAKSVLSVSAK